MNRRGGAMADSVEYKGLTLKSTDLAFSDEELQNY